MPRPPRRRRSPHWAAYLWPGLAHLWVRGSLAGLVLALAFSVLLNVLVLSLLVWPAWLEPRLKLACAAGAALLWIAALWETRGELRRLAEKRNREHENEENPDQAETDVTPHPNDQRLADAQKCYLRGEWVGAERLLRQAVWDDRRDVEARLWHVMLLRRTGRTKQARRRIKSLERLDAAEAWRYEISQEWVQLTPAAPTQSPTLRTETTEETDLPQQMRAA